MPRSFLFALHTMDDALHALQEGIAAFMAENGLE